MGLGQVLRQFTVGVSLAFDKSGFNKAAGAVDSFGKDLLGFSAKVGGAAASLFGLAAISGDNSRQLQLQAAQIGLTTDELQKLGYAAKITSDVGREELVGTLESLSKTLYEARNISSDAGRTFNRLGVSMQTLEKGNVNDVLMELSKTFSTMPDGMMKTALAAEAFGGAGTKLLPLLNKGPEGIRALGKEAQSAGLILSNTFLKQGADYDRKLSKIWFQFKNIAYVIGGSLIKYLLPLVNQFQKFLDTNRKLISLNIGVALQAIGNVIKLVGGAVFFLLDALKPLFSMLGGIEGTAKVLAVIFGAWLAVTSPLTTVVLGLALAFQDIFTYLKGGKSYFGDFVEWAKSIWIFRKIGDVFKEIIQFITPVIEKLNEVLHITEAIGDAFKAFKTVGGWAAGAISSVGHFLANGPEMSPAVAGGGGATSNQMNTNVTVTVPDGTSSSEAANFVSKGVEDALSSVLRHTRNQVQGGRKN